MPVPKQPPQRSIARQLSVCSYILFRKQPFIPYIFKWIWISLVLGVLIGSASAGFLYTLDRVTQLREQHIWLLALLPIGGLISGWLYDRYGRSVAGGNNLIIDTIEKPGAVIPFRMAPLVYLGTLLTHLSGGSAGREGTAVQMAGAIGDQLHKPLKLSSSERSTMLMASVAAGFGSVFGTPLAGALFGIEFFRMGHIRYRSLFPALSASLCAYLVTQAWQVPHTPYIIGFIPALSFTHLLWTLIAGILFGVCAAIFTKGMEFCAAQFKQYIAYAPARTFTGALIVLLLVWIIGDTQYIGLGIPAISGAFQTPAAPDAFALKMLLTLITLSAGFKGGEVTPLFFIGATLGSALSLFIPLPFALLAGMGFVAVFSGATNTPLSCSIMGIELFGSTAGPYIAIACITAYVCSGHNSIYSSQLIHSPKYPGLQHHKDKRMKDL